MDNIVDVVNYKKCTGCGACANLCPQGAISIKKNKRGFLVPVVNKSKCIDCGLCNKACPMINEIPKISQYSIPMVYAGWNKDEKIRMNSSSGGVFSVLADFILDKKGYICGASFDKKNKLKHIIISNRRDLYKLRGSKYIQSEIKNVLKRVKKLLEKDKWVLFSGTPCQVAGLKSFLKKDYENLIAVDLVCHGVPSPLVFERYLKEIEIENKTNINKIEFRDKSTGWRSYSFKMSNKKEDLVNDIHDNNVFFKGFLNNLYLNSICTNCSFAKFPRYSDITLGDYWGIWDYKKELDDDKGTSLIVVNNNKGNLIFNQIRDKLFFEEIPKDVAIEKLKTISFPCVRHQNRNDFFEDIYKKKKGMSSLINKHLNPERDADGSANRVGIFNMRLPTENFGAILQSFALYKTINDLGYKVKVINYVSDSLEKQVDKLSVLNLNKFRENNIRMTHRCVTDVDLINLNKDFDTFVVGSDQVWNYNYLNETFKNDIGKYFLNFVDSSKNIFSYAASFAKDHWGGNGDEIKTVKEALERFSSVSVRGKSGIKICKDLFNVNAKCVLDPTLLLKADDYQKIIESEHFKKNNEKYLAYFILDSDLEKKISNSEFLKKITKNHKWQLKNIRGYVEKIFNEDKFIYNSIPSWLNYIKNCKFIITDSYHGMIFAIIFKKQFVVLERDYAGNERLNNLLSILKIKDRFYSSLKKKDYISFIKNKIDYKKVSEILDLERKKSLKFLKKGLKIDSQILVLLNKIKELEIKNQTLESKYGELEFALQSYKNTKTFRYASKVKNLLLKLGMKIFFNLSIFYYFVDGFFE